MFKAFRERSRVEKEIFEEYRIKDKFSKAVYWYWGITGIIAVILGMLTYEFGDICNLFIEGQNETGGLALIGIGLIHLFYSQVILWIWYRKAMHKLYDKIKRERIG